MKRYIYLIVVLSVAIISCNSQSVSNDPGNVAVALYTALTDGESMQYVKDNIYFSDSARHKTFSNYLDIVAASPQYRKNIQKANVEYSVAEQEVNGDVANVVIVGTGPLGQRLRISVRLLCIDGEWKVDGNHGVWHNTRGNKR